MLRKIPGAGDPNLLVGFDTSDDAGVYRLTDDIAIVTTADFITPPVDDPFLYGQIAAANSLSDIYAMGGRPLVCLNLICFPSGKLEPVVMHDIVAGALDKITEAGAVLAGGHTIDDDEPKFGLAVTGVVHPDRYWGNDGARPGDVLILTKPVGSGVLFNANIKNWVSTAALEACLETLTTLNKAAADTMAQYDIHAATDVTGFGLAGHGFEMADAAGVCLHIEMDRIPVMDEALDMYRRGMNTGVNAFNRQMVSAHLRFDIQLPDWHQEIVFDPQTSGGLLTAVPADQAPELVVSLRAAGVPGAVVIGRVVDIDDQGMRLVFK
jgi:selenide,water dikinase